jgi:hypothetical protein
VVSFWSSSVAASPYTALRPSGLAMRCWNSASSARSLPRNQLKMPISSTPTSVDGMVTDSTVTKSITGVPAGTLARKATSETMATDTGLAMMPIWLAMDEAAMGRSGRMSLRMATS